MSYDEFVPELDSSGIGKTSGSSPPGKKHERSVTASTTSSMLGRSLGFDDQHLRLRLSESEQCSQSYGVLGSRCSLWGEPEAVACDENWTICEQRRMRGQEHSVM